MTIDYKGPENFTYFDFYTSGGTNGPMVDSLSVSKAFRMGEVRLHLSVVHPSVVDFTIRLSSILGSAYNQILVSQAMSSVKEYLWQPTRPLEFNSGDQLVFSLYFASGTNIYGLNVKGWSVL